ncbi:cystathionine gamma-lyase-like isoform X1 [Octopus vulgaris]|uniref:Cystathionine gamma-lyase-like isoform X1 n=2 Tax=Octopus TaxID=6643 RepID=A0AA36FIB6_OCTVU|nr:cystathionine gamma-lyase [Octopus sinensis]CAI9739850.1 cystathionine gamma-lyase-like isoform X1 [Octopus vulgaris]
MSTNHGHEFGKSFPHFATNAIHEGQEPDQWNSRMVVPPITMSTTFKQKEPGNSYGFDYSRSGNPTRNCLEKCIASLEGAKHALCMASGLAANDLVTRLLKAGDHIVSMDDMYGGTNRYFRTMEQLGISITFVDATDINKFAAAFQENTKLVWIETPTNPLMKVVDIAAACKVTKEKSDAIVAIDNTFCSPYFQRPLDFGADIVVHSMTKYMNGHSDAVMGCIALNDDKMAARLRFLQNACGAVPSPFDCYLVNRGLKTLHVRMKEHQKNGLAVAKFLENNPRVVKILHPGLPSHPQYELAKRQMRGFSGMVSLYIKGGIEESKKFLQNLKLFTTAESLGGFESLIELPAIMTHASVPEFQRVQLGLGDNLIRLSVGIECEEDLIADIDQALKIAIPE